MKKIPPFNGVLCMIDKKGRQYCGWLWNGHPFCPYGCDRVCDWVGEPVEW